MTANSEASVFDQLIQIKVTLENHNVPPPYTVKLTREQIDQLREDAEEYLLYGTVFGQISFFGMRIEESKQ